MSAAMNSGLAFCAWAKGATPRARSTANETVFPIAICCLPIDKQSYYQSLRYSTTEPAWRLRSGGGRSETGILRAPLAR